MPKRTGDFESWHLEKLEDPINAANYLNAVWEDAPELFLDAVKDVIQARKVTRVAKQAGVARESIYRTFSGTGNPTLDTFKAVLGALDVEISGFRPRGASSAATLAPKSAKTTSSRRRRRRRSIARTSPLQLSFTYNQAPLVPPVSTAVGASVALATSSLGVGTAIVSQINLGTVHRAKEPTYVSAPPGFYGYIANNLPPALANSRQ